MVKLSDILEADVPQEYFLSDKLMGKLVVPAPPSDGLPLRNATKRGYLIAREGDGVDLRYPESELRRARVGTQRSNTLSCGNQNGVVVKVNGRLLIRRLTPRECWRLQGFPDKYFDRAKAAGVSDVQLYRQAGNAITVTVARAIGEALNERSNTTR